MRTVALFAGIPPDPESALRGPITREPRYRAVFAAGEAWAGAPLAIAAADPRVRARGALDARRLPSGAALHTPLLERAAARLAELAATIEVRAPAVPVLSHESAEFLSNEQEVRRALAGQLAAPVRWSACV